MASTAEAAVCRRQQVWMVCFGESDVSTMRPLHARRINSFAHNALSCRTVERIGAQELCAFDRNSIIESEFSSSRQRKRTKNLKFQNFRQFQIVFDNHVDGFPQ